MPENIVGIGVNVSVTPFQGELIEKFTGGRKITEYEIQATSLALLLNAVNDLHGQERSISQPLIEFASTAEDQIASLRERHPDEFDPDVVGILIGVYKDKEQIEAERIRKFANSELFMPRINFLLYSISYTAALLGLISVIEGDMNMATIDLIAAGGSYTAGKILNHLSGGKNDYLGKLIVHDVISDVFTHGKNNKPTI